MNMQKEIEAIAVIGMDGRFPGADDVASYWNNLCAGVESIHRFTPDELDRSVARETRDAPEYVPARGVLRDADRFDAAFFDIPPREAEVLDPQQRVFMEIAWRALEDAGYAPSTHDALVGVFAGMSYNTYHAAHVAKHPEVLAGLGDIQALLASEKDYLTTRIAYKFNLRGPCVNISTACSTSLVAVCHAVNSLLNYQCDLALAGGISILCPQERGYAHVDGGIWSPDGHCRPFDAAAQGTVFGNGGAAVVLKRLSEAHRDGDTIRAVIRGAAMNNDGAGKISFTAPGVEGQAQVVQMAQAFAGATPGDIDYIEAHGTGTALGDPVEVAALTQVFRLHTRARNFCGLGSVKSNIGHLDAASGIAGLVKTVLALEHRKLPPTLHFTRANPELALEDSPFYVVDKLRDWPARPQGGDRPHRAAVSSFGLGGTNAHVVLEEAPAPEEAAPARAQQLLVLSAKTDAALAAARDALREFLEKPASAPFADIAWTLQAGRQAFERRLALVAGDRAEAVEILRRARAPDVLTGRAAATQPAVVFLFPGQGSQYAGMGRIVYENEPLVRETIDACADALGNRLSFDLRDVMFGRIENAAALLNATRYTQPALFALEVALAKLWMSWGLRPAALIGHSVGEFAAATLAGVFQLDDAVRLVAERGRLMQRQPAGVMLSVRLSEEELAEHLVPGVALAAANAPGLCVVSGEDAVIESFTQRLDVAGIVHSRLRTSHAFHSAMMDPVFEPFAAKVAALKLSAPEMEIISTRTGRALSIDEATSPDYWARQLREPVRFHAALRTVGERGPCAFLETGPGIAASTFAARTFGADAIVATSLDQPADDEKQDEAAALLRAAGRLWSRGVPLDWRALHAGEQRRRVSAPTYRFERTRHWLESCGSETAATRPAEQPVTKPVEPTGGMPERLRDMLATVTGLPADKLATDAAFTELGLDSLSLTQFSQQIRKQFKVELRFRQLLDEYNSLAAVAALLESQGRDAPVAEPATAKKADVVTLLRPDVAAGMPFGPAARVRRRAAEELTTQQQHYLGDLCRRYTWRTSGSKASVRTHRKHLADPRTVSGFDPLLKEMVYPIVVQSSSGSKLRDVDGNTWIDLVGGFGSSLFGHSPPFVVEALKTQLKRGFEIGPQTPLAGKVAGLMQALTGFERVSFCTTGSEAVLAALRVARTVTGRERIVMFADDYHGIFDEVLARPGGDGALPAAPGIPPEMLRNVLVLEYGAKQSLARIAAEGERLAAVLVEPVQGRHPERYAPEFLRELRAITARSGAALIFDEIVTGFRVHPAGVQGLLELRADLATYGKICGGGMPLGVLAGSRRFMDALDGGDWNYSDESVPEADMTFFAGTHVRHPLALAAAEAVLTHLLEKGVPLQQELSARTARLVAELEAHCEATGAPVRFQRFASWFVIDVDADVPCGGLLYYRMRAGGIHVWEGRLCFLTTSHTDADLAVISRVFRETVEEMQAAGFFRQEQAEPVPLVAAGALAASSAGARLGRRPNGEPGWFIPDPDRPGRYREVRKHRVH